MGEQTNGIESIPFRACCGKLRWELLDLVDGLAGDDVHLKALRWGTGEVPLDIDLDARRPHEVVDTVLREAARFLGANTSCFMGGGSLVIARGDRAGGRRC